MFQASSYICNRVQTHPNQVLFISLCNVQVYNSKLLTSHLHQPLFGKGARAPRAAEIEASNFPGMADFEFSVVELPSRGLKLVPSMYLGPHLELEGKRKLLQLRRPGSFRNEG